MLAGWQRGQIGGPEPSLGPELAGDEPDRHDPVLLGRVQQTLSGPLPGGVVLESHLVEPGQGVPNVRLVVDGQPAVPFRVDVGEGAIWKTRPVTVAEPSHIPKIPDPDDTRGSGRPRASRRGRR